LTPEQCPVTVAYSVQYTIHGRDGPQQDQHRFNLKAWLLWTAGFLAFPIGGALATGATGRINDVGSALIGGLVAGAVIGTGQWLVARRLLDPRTWIPATAVAMGIGLMVGAWAVGYGTSLGELALMGFITGIPLGAAQAYLLRDRVASAWVWAAAVPLLWALAGRSRLPAALTSTNSSRSSGPTARSPSWPCRGSCWTGCAPPPQRHSPTRQPRSSSSHPAHLAASRVTRAGPGIAATPGRPVPARSRSPNR
jgi:hypothetical protein